MKPEKMRIVGRSLLLMGIALAVIGTITVFTSLTLFNNCELAPAGACAVTTALYASYVTTQTFGNSLGFYGMVSLILGAVMYISAGSKLQVMLPREEIVTVPQQN